MRLTNGEILSAREPLQALIAQKFPVLVSYKLAKIVGKLNPQLKVIDEVKNGLIKRYGVENGRGYVVPEDSENFGAFAQEFDELMAQVTEVVLEKVNLPGDFEIEPIALMALEKFIEVNEDGS